MNYDYVMRSVLDTIQTMYTLSPSRLHDRVVADVVLRRRVKPNDPLIPERSESYMDLDASGIVQVDDGGKSVVAPFCFIGLFLEGSSNRTFRLVAPYSGPTKKIAFWQDWEQFVAGYEALRATALRMVNEPTVCASTLYGAAMMNPATKQRIEQLQLKVPPESTVEHATNRFPDSHVAIVAQDTRKKIAWEKGTFVVVNAPGAAADVYTFWCPPTPEEEGLHVFVQAKHTSPDASNHSTLNLAGTTALVTAASWNASS